MASFGLAKPDSTVPGAEYPRARGTFLFQAESVTADKSPGLPLQRGPPRRQPTTTAGAAVRPRRRWLRTIGSHRHHRPVRERIQRLEFMAFSSRCFLLRSARSTDLENEPLACWGGRHRNGVRTALGPLGPLRVSGLGVLRVAEHSNLPRSAKKDGRASPSRRVRHRPATSCEGPAGWSSIKDGGQRRPIACSAIEAVHASQSRQKAQVTSSKVGHCRAARRY